MILRQSLESARRVTIEAAVHRVNDALQVGDTFRLIGRATTFRALRLTQHAVAGLLVYGESLDGKQLTAARVCDTMMP